MREELGNAQGKLMTTDLNFSCLRKMWSKNVNSMFSIGKDKHRKKQQLLQRPLYLRFSDQYKYFLHFYHEGNDKQGGIRKSYDIC